MQLTEAVDVATVSLRVLEPIPQRKGPEELSEEWGWTSKGRILSQERTSPFPSFTTTLLHGP